MSGGHFEYSEYAITGIKNSIQLELDRQGTEKPKDFLYMDDEYYKEHPEAKLFDKYSEQVQRAFKSAIRTLKFAEMYVHHIDYLLSGDHGEESFIRNIQQGELQILTEEDKASK